MLPPEKLTFEGERDNAEYTLVHNWMKMWLRWLHWYCSVALSPTLLSKTFSLLQFVVLLGKDQTRILIYSTFGLLWKCYDLVEGDWLNNCPLPLGEGDVRFPGWIRGGMTGTDFMMVPSDHQSQRDIG